MANYVIHFVRPRPSSQTRIFNENENIQDRILRRAVKRIRGEWRGEFEENGETGQVREINMRLNKRLGVRGR